MYWQTDAIADTLPQVLPFAYFFVIRIDRKQSNSTLEYTHTHTHSHTVTQSHTPQEVTIYMLSLTFLVVLFSLCHHVLDLPSCKFYISTF